jgi:hypothetical protein
VIGEQQPSTELGIWKDAAVGKQFRLRERTGHAATPAKIPFQIKRIHPDAIGRVGWLEYQIHGNGVDGVFKVASEKSRQVIAGQNPSIAQTEVPDSCIAAASRDRMPT